MKKINWTAMSSMLSVFMTLGALAPQAWGASLDQNLSSYGNAITKSISNGREVHLYHWALLSNVLAGKDNSTPLGTSDERVKEYLGYLRDDTFTPGNGSGVAGPGIYAAIDPIVTCSYGGCLSATSFSPGMFVQFVLVSGVKFLDGTSSHAWFSAELASQLQQAGCSARDVTSLFASSGAAGCRSARDRLIALTGTSALRYSYGSSAFQNCPDRIPAAFVLFGDDAINWDRLVDFTASLPGGVSDGHMENRRIIESLFSMQGGSYDGMPWPGLKNQSPQSTNMATWMSANLMGCGNWPEDQSD